MNNNYTMSDPSIGNLFGVTDLIQPQSTTESQYNLTFPDKGKFIYSYSLKTYIFFHIASISLII